MGMRGLPGGCSGDGYAEDDFKFLCVINRRILLDRSEKMKLIFSNV